MNKQFIPVTVVLILACACVLAAQNPSAPPTNRPETKPWNAPQKPRSGPAQPTSAPRPSLFFREEWKRPDGGSRKAFPDPCCWALTDESLSNSNLELQLYGATEELSLVGTAGDESNPIHVFTGLCSTPCAISFRDKKNYVDLSRGKIRWNAKTAGFHAVRPLIKLADGTYLLGDFSEGNSDDWRQSEFYPSQLRWIRMDPDRVIAYGYWIQSPDLSKVDEVGWADLLPGSGHNQGGYVDVAAIEVYGKPVPRDAGAPAKSK